MERLFYLFPLFFIGMWVLVTFIISKMGWADLATHYLYEGEFTGKRIGIISASINNANYRNALILKYNQEGIYLRPIILFRLFHKPVFIPWKEIKEARDKKVLFYTFKQLIIGDPFVAIIGIKKSIFSELENNFNSLPRNK
jgi:hypothetical protein